MLEIRNFLQKKINKKGFTLAELLVVVAIIAILVAVSIPIFTGKLNEAKVSTDKANERAAKAAVVTAYLQDKNADTTATVYYEYDAENGKVIKATGATTTTVKGYGATKDNNGKVVMVKVEGKSTAGAGGTAGTEASPEITTSWQAGKSS